MGSEMCIRDRSEVAMLEMYCERAKLEDGMKVRSHESRGGDG